eukprot:PhM_4_TR8031/c1_g1_i1/m.45857
MFFLPAARTRRRIGGVFWLTVGAGGTKLWWDYKTIEQMPPPKTRWNDVKDTLQTGDVLLLMGTGSVSKKICAASYFWFGLKPHTLEYSHVGVIVRRGDKILLLEAIDNEDIRTPDVDGAVRTKQVQVVDPEHRIFGKQGERRCYSRCAVRRLLSEREIDDNVVEKFVSENVGRPLDTNPDMLLSYLHPSLYKRADNSVSCSELIVSLYEHLGIADVKGVGWDPVAIAPAQLGFSTPQELFFTPGNKLGNVQRINMKEP